MEAKKWDEWAKKLNEDIRQWLEAEATKTEDGYKCVKCGNSLMSRTVHCSIHDGYSLFGTHAGAGQVHRFGVPECPNEECPNHRPSFWTRGLHLDGNTLYGPCYDS